MMVTIGSIEKIAAGKRVLDLEGARGSWRLCLLGTPLELSGVSARLLLPQCPQSQSSGFLPCAQYKPNSTTLHPDHGPVLPPTTSTKTVSQGPPDTSDRISH